MNLCFLQIQDTIPDKCKQIKDKKNIYVKHTKT